MAISAMERWLLAAADQFLDMGHAGIQVQLSHILEPQAAGGGIDQPGSDHGIKAERGGIKPMAAQDEGIVLEVVADLLDSGIGKSGTQGIHDLCRGPGWPARWHARPGCNSPRPP